MRGRILKWMILIWGAASLYVFISIRIQPMFNSILKEKVVENYWDRTKYGEMYYFSMIRHFREPGLPEAKQKFEHSSKHAPVSDSDILTFGDSFFEFSRHKQFPERLADDFQKKVHYVNNDHPLDYLNDNNYNDTIPRLVIYERTERFIPVSFEKEHKNNPVLISKDQNERSILAKMKDLIFYEKSEELYNVILKRSYLSTSLYSFFATLKFDLFGYISSLTPAYHVNGSNSWLFYHDQVNGEKTSFYYDFKETEIDSICDNMADLAKKLQEKYNLYLLYLPVPAKYTLYHGIINDDPYNNFLPRLYKGLKERDVMYVNIYDDFKNCSDTLYYRTDSHWKQTGIDMAYAKTITYIQRDSVLSSLLKGDIHYHAFSQSNKH